MPDVDCSHVAEIFCDVKEITIDEQTRIGIIYTEKNGNFDFIHHTFAEFFIAQYFFEEIFEKNDFRKEVGELLCQIITYEGFDIVRKFIQDQIDVQKINEGLSDKLSPKAL